MVSTSAGFAIPFMFLAAFVIIFGCIKLASKAERNGHNAAGPQHVHLRSVRCDPIMLRRLREQERQSWARDDIESARQEKGGLIVRQSSIRK